MEQKPQIFLDTTNPSQVRAFYFARSLCAYAQKDDIFLASFWNRLIKYPDVYEEFLFYLEKQDYLCKVNIQGYTIIDIMVWQMDHFKAELDRDKSDMKQNGDAMLLMAFHTLLCMQENPLPFLAAMQSETGTDYPEKY